MAPTTSVGGPRKLVKPDPLAVEGSSIQQSNKKRRKRRPTLDSDDETLTTTKHHNKVLRVMLPKLQEGQMTDGALQGSESINNVLCPWNSTQRASHTFLNFGNAVLRNTPANSMKK